jgi:glycosyltransferase involved in cell wall biosynthesis
MMPRRLLRVARMATEAWVRAPIVPLRDRRRVRLIAMLAVRNQVHHLPGFIANVAPNADGIVALDDGSTDGSAELLESHPAVLDVVRVAPERPSWDEVGNHRALVAAGLRHGADWLLCVDADERLEHRFRARAEATITRGRLLGIRAFAVRMLELWDDPHTYRTDGIWGGKTRARLFRASAGHVFDERELHGHKASLGDRHLGVFPVADLHMYHLGTLTREDRLARRRRYEIADPEAKWQPRDGYGYLTDERGLELRRIPPSRDYVE